MILRVALVLSLLGLGMWLYQAQPWWGWDRLWMFAVVTALGWQAWRLLER
jgi:hypothetical protein